MPDNSDDLEVARVHTPHDTGGTYEEYAAVQKMLRQKARRVVTTYEHLYRLGRTRGL